MRRYKKRFAYTDHPETKKILETTTKNTIYLFWVFKQTTNKSTYAFAGLLSTLGARRPIQRQRIEFILYNKNINVDLGRQIYEVVIWLALAEYAKVSLQTFMYQDIYSLDKAAGRQRVTFDDFRKNIELK